MDNSEFQPKSTRILVIGILAIVAGAGLLMMALLVAVMAALESPEALNALPVYILAGLFFGALGVFTVMKKRWIRPIGWSVSILGIALGLYGSFICVILLPPLFEAMSAPQSGLITGLVIFVLVVFFSGGSAVLLLAYHGSDMKKSFEMLDPKPVFTDKIPDPVFLVILLNASSVVSLLTAMFKPSEGFVLGESVAPVYFILFSLLLIALNAGAVYLLLKMNIWGLAVSGLPLLLGSISSIRVFSSEEKVMDMFMKNQALDFQTAMSYADNLPTPLLITTISAAVLQAGLLIFMIRYFKADQKS